MGSGLDFWYDRILLEHVAACTVPFMIISSWRSPVMLTLWHYIAGLVVLLCLQQGETYYVVGRLFSIYSRNRIANMLDRNISFYLTARESVNMVRHNVVLTRPYNWGAYQNPDGEEALMAMGFLIQAIFVRRLT